MEELCVGARVPLPNDRLVHQIFEEQVGRSSDAPALICDERRMTYAELDASANRLARHIREQGVGPEQVVGVCIERSLEMIVGVLAILKVGGAYLPLDPGYPSDRLRFMLEDAKPRALVTQQKLRGLLPDAGVSVSLVDGDAAGSEWSTAVAPEHAGLAAKNLIYVIYTSGSTGRPKGTSMSHRSMVNLIEWHRRELGANGGRKVLQYAALNFDVAFQEIFSTLCTGGTLVVAREEVRKDPRALLGLLRKEAIERFFVTPLMLQRIAEICADESQLPRSLRDVITAGDQLRISPPISSFFRRLGSCRLHNHYGPTETHVVTTWTLGEDAREWPTLPPIGRPISNASIYVLDDARQPVPRSTPGEIYIGGEGVARGYFDRPELTAQRFVANPFGIDSHTRLYKTGDLGRWRADGVLEYLGRNDFQVKIRGFRVELGEVEAALESYKGVRHSAVVAREDLGDEKRLVAYVVAEASRVEGDEVGAASHFVPRLRAFLKEKLPDYMMPAVIALLNELPTTPNGKIDRNALPTPPSERQLEEPYVAPTSTIEAAIVDVWKEVLRVHPVGIDDNFFELGGDSVMGLELVAKVAERLSIDDLAIIALFEGPTVREMAQFIESEALDEARA